METRFCAVVEYQNEWGKRQSVGPERMTEEEARGDLARVDAEASKGADGRWHRRTRSIVESRFWVGEGEPA